MACPMVVIGASLGGLAALREILSGMPKDFSCAVAIVQHRGKEQDGLLRELLQEVCCMQVIEPMDKEPIMPGSVYLAPPDYHLLVEGDHFTLSTEAPVNHSRPSIDVLFESAAEAHQKEVVGVVLTGANEDGAQGVARIRDRGGITVVQDPVEAECAVMPAAAARFADKVLPLSNIAAFLTTRCTGQGRSEG